jgi:Ca-activated chloride channel family protein
MRFLQPEIGWWMLAGAALVWLVRWRLRWRFAATTDARVLGDRRYRASLTRRLPFALLVAALACTSLALMEPVLPYSQAEVQSLGLDVVVLLDLSSSMQEDMDAPPPARASLASTRVPAAPRPPAHTRLDATKNAIKTFVRGRRDDRIGLVVFSDNAYVVSPLTFDYDYLLHYVDMVDDQILRGEGQTAIGDGLALANYLMSRQSKGSRSHQVIVLFTDGENNRGRDPLESLADSSRANIRVHMIGVDIDKEVKAKPAVQQLLTAVKANGGRYFNATSERDLLAASRSIDSIEKGLLVNKVYVHDVPVYQWFAVPALLLLAAAMAVRAIPYFIDQT